METQLVVALSLGSKSCELKTSELRTSELKACELEAGELKTCELKAGAGWKLKWLQF